jgi:hypothetical protein
MSEFIDLAGASGVVYRFQRVPDLGALPAIAGNFVYVRGQGSGMSVICAGTGETLLDAGKHWAEAVREHQAEAIFVRKNVSRRSREQEHRDIVEARAPSMDAGENFAGSDSTH